MLPPVTGLLAEASPVGPGAAPCRCGARLARRAGRRAQRERGILDAAATGGRTCRLQLAAPFDLPRQNNEKGSPEGASLAIRKLPAQLSRFSSPISASMSPFLLSRIAPISVRSVSNRFTPSMNMLKNRSRPERSDTRKVTSNGDWPLR